MSVLNDSYTCTFVHCSSKSFHIYVMYVPVPQIPNSSRIVLSACVHPFSIFMKPHTSDIFRDSIIVDDRIGIARVQVIHTNVLVTWIKYILWQIISTISRSLCINYIVFWLNTCTIIKYAYMFIAYYSPCLELNT